MKRSILLLAVAVMVAGSAFPAVAAPPGNPIVPDAIWADGDLYGTRLLNPLPYNGNDHSFDQLYLVPGQQPVAEAAPGPGYNGGRWLPTPVEKTDTFPEGTVLMSAADVAVAADAGWIVVGDPMTDAAFLCPLIPGR